jgi:hypothetical protein
MCGGVYEEDFEDNPKEDSDSKSENDLKFTTAKDFIDAQKESIYPGGCAQE